MDISKPADVARRIGVSLPTVHAIFDREGVARSGRGVERLVPLDVAERVMRERAAGYTRTEIRVLAALAVSPLGLSSARQVAEVAGISPTSASAALTRLVDHGLVRRKERRALRAGRAVVETVSMLDMRSERWADVESAVRAVRLTDRPVRRSTRLPQAFWHLFWNSEPAKLRLSSDGAYIARRMLGSMSMAAAQWALQHVAAADLFTAVSARGTDERTRAMVRNWIPQPDSAISIAQPRRAATR